MLCSHLVPPTVALALCSDGREGLVDMALEPYDSQGATVVVNAQGRRL